ncbi:MAG: hypothetical protein FWH56_03060 [Betaproteobacteria bacterium]|nr:hypothetical protein [Betaproteobacteria bacterium]
MVLFHWLLLNAWLKISSFVASVLPQAARMFVKVIANQHHALRDVAPALRQASFSTEAEAVPEVSSPARCYFRAPQSKIVFSPRLVWLHPFRNGYARPFLSSRAAL